MNERQSVGILKKSLLEHNIWNTILVDSDDYAARPFDQVICYKGRFIGAESKFQKSFKAFGMKQLRDGQIRHLDALYSKDSGGLGFVFLFIWVPNKENRLLAWEWEHFKKVTSEGSIKMKDLKVLPCIQGRKGRFPVDELLNLFEINFL